MHPGLETQQCSY